MRMMMSYLVHGLVYRDVVELEALTVVHAQDRAQTGHTHVARRLVLLAGGMLLRPELFEVPERRRHTHTPQPLYVTTLEVPERRPTHTHTHTKHSPGGNGVQ